MRLTHLPLNVQSLGHRFSTISDTSGGISGFSSPLSLTYEDTFLPIISPHSFISNVTAERANEVSPVSWNIKKIHVVPFYQQLSQSQKTVTPEIFSNADWVVTCQEKNIQKAREQTAGSKKNTPMTFWVCSHLPGLAFPCDCSFRQIQNQIFRIWNRQDPNPD